MSKRQTTFIPGKPFWVNVRQEHIDAGVQTDCKRCPVHLAIADRLPLFQNETHKVEVQLWSIPDKRDYYDLPLPEVAVEAIDIYPCIPSSSN